MTSVMDEAICSANKMEVDGNKKIKCNSVVVTPKTHQDMMASFFSFAFHYGTKLLCRSASACGGDWGLWGWGWWSGSGGHWQRWRCFDAQSHLWFPSCHMRTSLMTFKSQEEDILRTIHWDCYCEKCVIICCSAVKFETKVIKHYLKCWFVYCCTCCFVEFKVKISK